jgi:hypothetical protein
MSSLNQADFAFNDEQIHAYWLRLNCRLPGIEQSFSDYVMQAVTLLDTQQLNNYIEQAHQLSRWGRGADVVNAWLQYWPGIESQATPQLQSLVLQALTQLNRSPNSHCMAAFLESVSKVCTLWPHSELTHKYIDLVLAFMQSTSSSIHGNDLTIASAGLAAVLQTAPELLKILSLQGLSNWLNYGVRVYRNTPQQQIAYFQRESKDSLAVIQQNRHGTLLGDVDRQLGVNLLAQWQCVIPRAAFDSENSHHKPTYHEHTIGLPDVLDDLNGVSAKMRYQLMQAHIAAHVQWSTPLFADNWSPLQRMCVEWFEDIRMDVLILQQYPGFKRYMLPLMPSFEHMCSQATHSCILYKLSVLSRCVLDCDFEALHPDVQPWSQSLRHDFESSAISSERVAQRALQWLLKHRHPSDQKSDVDFQETHWDWRDDNRILWRYIEEGDEEDTQASPSPIQAQELTQLPACTYPEWDYLHACERPDWVSVYEYLQPSGDPKRIDQLLEQHRLLARQLEGALEVLKPQDRTRIRHLEQGSEIDFDLALEALTDWRCAQTPSERTQQDTVPCSRDISVQVLMDLSTSLNEPTSEGESTLLELSQCAVSLLAWAMDRLGDEFAISGFHSNTRHDVRYMHIKGYSESWGTQPKARLANVQALWSTRMGAALRHSARTLKQRAKSKKLLLVLTDGQPSDIDVQDERWLIEDARKAVQSLRAQGIHVWCMQMHPQHSELTQRIYGHHYLVTNNIHQLANDLLRLFIHLTG